MHKTYLNWEQIHSLQNVAFLNWTERNAVPVVRGGVVRDGVWSRRPDPLTDFVILTALPSLNQLLLLQNSLIILVNSWDAGFCAHSEFTDRCYQNNSAIALNFLTMRWLLQVLKRLFEPKEGMTWWLEDDKSFNQRSHTNTYFGKNQETCCFFFLLLHWPFLLAASFWHIINLYDKRLYIS